MRAQHIIKMKKDNADTTPAIQTAYEAPAITQIPTHSTETVFGDPQLRLLQEIKFLLIVIIVLKLICLLIKK